MTETRDFVVDHTAGEVSIAPTGGADKIVLTPDEARALAHILTEHARAARADQATR